MSFKVNDSTVLGIAKNSFEILKVDKKSGPIGTGPDITELKTQVAENTEKINNFQSVISDSFPNGNLILSENNVSKASNSLFDNSSSSITNDTVGGAFTITDNMYITRLSIPMNHWADSSAIPRTFTMWSGSTREQLWKYSIPKTTLLNGDYILDIVPRFLTPGSYRFGIDRFAGQLSANISSRQVFSDFFTDIYGVYHTDQLQVYPDKSGTPPQLSCWLSGNFSYVYRTTRYSYNSSEPAANIITPDSGILRVNGIVELANLRIDEFKTGNAVISDQLTVKNNFLVINGNPSSELFTVDSVLIRSKSQHFFSKNIEPDRVDGGAPSRINIGTRSKQFNSGFFKTLNSDNKPVLTGGVSFSTQPAPIPINTVPITLLDDINLQLTTTRFNSTELITVSGNASKLLLTGIVSLDGGISNTLTLKLRNNNSDLNSIGVLVPTSEVYFPFELEFTSVIISDNVVNIAVKFTSSFGTFLNNSLVNIDFTKTISLVGSSTISDSSLQFNIKSINSYNIYNNLSSSLEN